MQSKCLSRVLKRLCEGTVVTKLSRFLLRYRLKPHTTMGRSPPELLWGRQPRPWLDILHPDVSGRVQESQAREQRPHDSHSRARAFQVGDQVYARNFDRISNMDGMNYFLTRLVHSHFEFSCQMDVSGSAILIMSESSTQRTRLPPMCQRHWLILNSWWQEKRDRRYSN